MRTLRNLILVALTATLPLQADTWSFTHDNDFFFDSDDQYTGGLQIDWLGATYPEQTDDSYNGRYVEGMSELVALTGFDLAGKHRTGGFSIQELIITPDDLESREPIYDDIPYVGYLSLNFSLFGWDERAYDEYRFTLGLIGPDSGAEKLQKSIHELTGNTEPKGWHNQLDNKPVVQLGYVRGMCSRSIEMPNHLRLDWFNSYSVDVGNVYVGIGGGTVLRFGQNMPKNFSTANGLLNSSQSHMLAFNSRTEKWGWALNAGIFSNAIGYFYLYEESKRLGYSYDRPRFFVTGRVGFDLYFEALQVSMELYPSGSVSERSESSSWGRIRLTWHYR
jgi:hypothetical protein